MNLEESIVALAAAGQRIERDPSFTEGDRWLVLDLNNPESNEDEEKPRFCDAEELITWACALSSPQ